MLQVRRRTALGGIEVRQENLAAAVKGAEACGFIGGGRRNKKAASEHERGTRKQAGTEGRAEGVGRDRLFRLRGARTAAGAGAV
jgi:hypothetical protein